MKVLPGLAPSEGSEREPANVCLLASGSGGGLLARQGAPWHHFDLCLPLPITPFFSACVSLSFSLLKKNHQSFDLGPTLNPG